MKRRKKTHRSRWKAARNGGEKRKQRGQNGFVAPHCVL